MCAPYKGGRNEYLIGISRGCGVKQIAFNSTVRITTAKSLLLKTLLLETLVQDSSHSLSSFSLVDDVNVASKKLSWRQAL